MFSVLEKKIHTAALNSILVGICNYRMSLYDLHFNSKNINLSTLIWGPEVFDQMSGWGITGSMEQLYAVNTLLL